jgi:AcrR family transcriptional regulator
VSPRRAGVLKGAGDLREHLISTAAGLIATRGTAGLTVREIARVAQVADGVLYNHFADKEDLLAEALHAHVRAAGQALAVEVEPGEGDLEAILLQLVRTGVAVHAAVLPAFAGLLGQPKVLARFADLPNPMRDGEGLHGLFDGYLRAEQAAGRIPGHADTGAAAALLVGVCHDQVLPRMLHAVPESPPGLLERQVHVVVRGLL